MLPSYRNQSIEKNQNFEKMEKIAKYIIILSMCTKTTITWGTVPEIRSEKDILVICCPFTPTLKNPENQNFEKMKEASEYLIILHLRTKNHDHMMYASWIWSATYIIFCHFGPHFAVLPHYWPWKLKFRKNVKNPGNIILSHMCTMNEDIMYSSWDIKARQV